MPRIIVKSGYLKSGKHREFYTKYMATREGAEIINKSFGQAEATAKQKEMIEAMLKDFPDAKNMFEYEDYMENPTRENASELISAIIEYHSETIATKENYVEYIANRPRVEKLGEHGLFTDSDDSIELHKVAQEIGNHNGYVWTHIISIKRDDATRLGYDNANAWKNICRAKRNELAKAMQIDPSNLKWYAAFHNESHHPHIHMIVYADDSRQGYLTKNGIKEIRKQFSNTIFKQDLFHLYETQTEKRDELKKISREQIKVICQSLQQPTPPNSELIDAIRELQGKLKNHKGRLVYGFLTSDTKKLVDHIVMILEKDERIKALYDAWYEMKEDVLHTYKDEVDIRLPLCKQKEFRSIKNMILQEVGQLSNAKTDIAEIEMQFLNTNNSEVPLSDDLMALSDVDPILVTEHKGKYQMQWNQRYKEAMKLLYNSEKNEGDDYKALLLLEKEANNFNVLALSELGKIYQRGIGLEIDEDKSNNYYKEALQGFYELRKTECVQQSYINYRIGKFYLYGLGTQQDYTKAKECFEKAHNNKYAIYLLGMMAKRGLGMEQDDAEAFTHFLKAAEMGNCYAQYETAIALEMGKGTEQDLEQAEDYYKKAFRGFEIMERQSRDDHLQYRLGKMCYEGKGVSQNTELAISYLKQSARMKNEHAQLLLAKIWINEHYYDHYEEAKKFLVDLSEKGNQTASMMLGKEYLRGEHFEKDIFRSITYLNRCENNSYANFMLYQAYRELQPPDIEKALSHLKSSAKQNNEIAQYHYGKYFLEGDVIEKDSNKALYWLQKSADQNNMFAQYLLGKLFLFGKEVSQDKEKAVYYLKSSADQGNEYAEYLLRYMNTKYEPSSDLMLISCRFFHHLSRIFQTEMLPKQDNPLLGIDHKLKKKLLDKRMALGHKKDDQTMNYN